MSKARVMLLVGVAVAAGLGGCGGQVFGGKEYGVAVATEPAGGTVWVVPYNQYLTKGVGDSFMSGVEPKHEWLVTTNAPATFQGQAYSMMALGKMTKDGRVLRGVTPRPFTPGTDKAVTVMLEAK